MLRFAHEILVQPDRLVRLVVVGDIDPDAGVLCECLENIVRKPLVVSAVHHHARTTAATGRQREPKKNEEQRA